MSKQSLRFSLHPTAITMLERALQSVDRTKLTYPQYAQIAPLRSALRDAQAKLNLMARADILMTTPRVILYTHPDKRESAGVMVYDRKAEALFTETPFAGTSGEDEILAWIAQHTLQI